MASLIPAIDTCVSRMSGGEKRLAGRLADKLAADWLAWYDVPLGQRDLHPDFVVFNPRCGLLVLEVKDWRLKDIQEIDRHSVSLLTGDGLQREANPLARVRDDAHEIVGILRRDPQLSIAGGRAGRLLLFPWGYGIVLGNITRRQFESTHLGEALEHHRVICSDEIGEGVEPAAFQSRLRGMLHFARSIPLAPPQIDRIRWHLFPEIRVAEETQPGLFDGADAEIPDLIRVLDLQQERLARSAGDGLGACPA